MLSALITNIASRIPNNSLDRLFSHVNYNQLTSGELFSNTGEGVASLRLGRSVSGEMCIETRLKWPVIP